MALFWLIRVTLHAVSTSLSHAATFTVLGGIRKQICEKLSGIPLLPVVMFIYLLKLDWRLGLSSLIGAAIGPVSLWWIRAGSPREESTKNSCNRRGFIITLSVEGNRR